MNIPDDGFFTLVTQGIQHRSDETLQRALYHTLRHAILQGTLAANCRLPGSRVMAGRLQLSRNTVNAALVPDAEPSGDAGGTARRLPRRGREGAARRAA